MRSVELSEDVSQPESDANVYRAAIVGYPTQYLLPTWFANYSSTRRVARLLRGASAITSCAR
eukprot:2800384-Prymnesium_polylepis.2